MVLAALIEFVWAATDAGIAIGLYPVLRKNNRSLALGSVAGRTVEGMLVLVGTLSLLALLTVGQESVAAGPAAASSSQVVGEALLAVRDWAHGFLGPLPFTLGVSIYYYLLYRSRLVPRWLLGWGLIGAGLCLVSTVNAGFTQDFGFTMANTLLNIPIGLQEMVLAVWLRACSVMMESSRRAPLPPRWFVRAAWVAHRAIYSITGGRRGLRSPTAEGWGIASRMKGDRK